MFFFMARIVTPVQQAELHRVSRNPELCRLAGWLVFQHNKEECVMLGDVCYWSSMMNWKITVNGDELPSLQAARVHWPHHQRFYQVKSYLCLTKAKGWLQHCIVKSIDNQPGNENADKKNYNIIKCES